MLLLGKFRSTFSQGSGNVAPVFKNLPSLSSRQTPRKIETLKLKP